MVTEGIDLDDLLEKLNEAMGLDGIVEEIDAVTAGADVAIEVEKLIESIVDMQVQHNKKYKPALDKYKTAYSTFESRALKLASVLKAAEEAVDKDSIDYSSITNAKEALLSARNDYVDKASTLHKELGALKDEIKKIFDALEALPTKLDDFSSKIEDSTLAADASTSTADWLNTVVGQVNTSMKILVGEKYEDDINAELALITAQKEKLNALTGSTVKSSWDADKVKSEYGPISITTISGTFDTVITELIAALDNKADVGEEAETSMTNLIDIVAELLGISGLYDSSLNSIVSEGNIYAATTMSVSTSFSVGSLGDLVSACEDFVDGITSLDIGKVLKALGKLLIAIGKFLVAVLAWVAESCVNLVLYLASGPVEWYNSLLLYGYGAYNMPNRTSFDTSPNNKNQKETLSGYSYNKITEMSGGTYTKSLTGALSDLSTITNQTGSDDMFKGAETEYLLIGSNAELYNQSATFFNLFMTRLVLDIVPVLKSPESNSIAALAGPGAWVVKILMVLAEPMLDSIILVNGGKVSLIKKTVYMSYSGFVNLQNDLVGITSISASLQGKIQDTIKAESGDSSNAGYLNANYTEHMLIMLMLSVGPDEYLKRLRNVIQLEAKTKHKSGSGFDMDEAYTFISTEVDYTLNPMFDIDSLTGSGLFTNTTEQYIGY
ncbi:MAG: DUF5702 domain-containing protein [Suipraeoptans sp.]